MEKKINILFGIIGGLFLVFLELPLFSSANIAGGRSGFIVEAVLSILSFFGLIFVIYFSILLILDTLKTIYKR